MAMRRAAIGISAHLGWAAGAVVAIDRGTPVILRTDRIATAAPGDRAALEPFHVAGGFQGLDRVPRPRDPEAGLRQGLRKQQHTTLGALERMNAELAAVGHTLVAAGILVGRGRPAPTFEKAVGSHVQIHVEEGLAVRAAFRNALEKLGAKVFEFDQKRVGALASQELGHAEDALMATLAALRPENGGPWRKEEKLAALAAWASHPRRSR